MLQSSLWNYSDAYILVKGTIVIAKREADEAEERDKVVICENFAPFTDCISEINNTQVDNAKDLDAAMLMYSLIEYSDNYSNI